MSIPTIPSARMRSSDVVDLHGKTSPVRDTACSTLSDDRLMTASSDPRPGADELAPLVYQQLRRLAGAYMRRESPGQTLQPTALVHEAYLRLAGEGTPWND